MWTLIIPVPTRDSRNQIICKPFALLTLTASPHASHTQGGCLIKHQDIQFVTVIARKIPIHPFIHYKEETPCLFKYDNQLF